MVSEVNDLQRIKGPMPKVVTVDGIGADVSFVQSVKQKDSNVVTEAGIVNSPVKVLGHEINLVLFLL